MFRKEINHLLRTEIIERRLEEVRLRVHMPAELVPCLQVCEIAPALSCDHDLASRALHLLQHHHAAAAVAAGYVTLHAAFAAKRRRRSRCRHKSRSTAANDDDLS